MTVVFTPYIHSLEFNQDLILDFHIDSPQSGVATVNSTLNLSGWVVGNKSDAIAIEVVADHQVILEAPIQIHRPRVAQRYAEIVGKAPSGFQVLLQLSEAFNTASKFIIQVVLKDTIRVPIAFLNIESYQRSYRKKTFFIHVAKTAGSSFNHFLQTHFIGDDHCEKYRKNGQQNQFKDLEKLRSLDYISGHLTFKEFRRDFERDDYFLVTLLRNPVHQVISHLNWVYYVGEDINSSFFKSHPRHDQEIILSVRQRNLSDYREVIQALLDHRGLFLNNQSRYFQTQKKLDENNIIENLSQFDLVGLTEEYQQFISDYIELQDLKIKPTIDIKNKSKKPAAQKNELINYPEFLEFMNEYNAVDMKVYDYFLKMNKHFNNKRKIMKLKRIAESIKMQKFNLKKIQDSIYS